MSPEPMTNLGDCLRLPYAAEATAFIDTSLPEQNNTFSARALDDLANALARKLLHRGIHAGDRIGIIGENSAAYLVCYLGIMRCGAVAVPINYKLPADTISFIIGDAACSLCFAGEGEALLVQDRVETLSLTSLLADVSAVPKTDFDIFKPVDEDLAEILYTSGSTGLPKGVPLTHSGQCWALKRYLQAQSANEQFDTTLIAAPFYHMNALFFMTQALCNRTAVVCMPRFEAGTYLSLVEKHRCTILSGVPTMFALAARASRPEQSDLSSVTSIFLGSSPLTEAILEDVSALFPKASVSNGYGTTEAGPNIFGPHPDGRETPKLSLGYPVAEIEWRFANGSDTQGALQIKTPALTKGYLNRPEVTAKKFDQGWYNTEDIMRRDTDGFFYFVGRADDMFVCGGENLYPGEIEKLLDSHSAIAQSAVVAVEDAIKGMVPFAFLVLKDGFSDLTAAKIKEYSIANGPAYAHPRHVEFLDELPLAGTNKVNKTLLQEAAQTIWTNLINKRASEYGAIAPTTSE